MQPIGINTIAPLQNGEEHTAENINRELQSELTIRSAIDWLDTHATVKLDFADNNYHVREFPHAGVKKQAKDIIDFQRGNEKAYTSPTGEQLTAGIDVPAIDWDPATLVPLGIDISTRDGDAWVYPDQLRIRNIVDQPWFNSKQGTFILQLDVSEDAVVLDGIGHNIIVNGSGVVVVSYCPNNFSVKVNGEEYTDIPLFEPSSLINVVTATQNCKLKAMYYVPVRVKKEISDLLIWGNLSLSVNPPLAAYFDRGFYTVNGTQYELDEIASVSRQDEKLVWRPTADGVTLVTSPIDELATEWDPVSGVAMGANLSTDTTNHVRYNDDLENAAWANDGVGVSPVTDPKLPHVFNLTAQATTGRHTLRQTIISDTTLMRRRNFYVKDNGAGYFLMAETSTSSVNTVVFDFAAGQYSQTGDPAYIDSVIEPRYLGDGWWLVGFYSEVDSTSYRTIEFGPWKGAGGYALSGWLGAGESVLVAIPQGSYDLEVSAPVIVPGATPVTRGADTVDMATAGWFNQQQGKIVFTGSNFEDSGLTYGRDGALLFVFTDSVSNNFSSQFVAGYYKGIDRLEVRYRNEGSDSIALIPSPGFSINESFTMDIVFKDGEPLQVSLNGAEPVVGTGNVVARGFDTLSFSDAYDGTKSNGHKKKFLFLEHPDG